MGEKIGYLMGTKSIILRIVIIQHTYIEHFFVAAFAE